jgi:hypothetical protein
MSQKRAFVHLLLEHFREACRGRGFEDLVALNEGLDAILTRYGSGWRKPSAGEAVLAGEPPWFQFGKVGSPLDWGASLRDSISSELHLDSSVGIAASEVAAQICSRLARPRGVLVWMPGHERGLLDGMPLEELDELRPQQLARLRSEGIATLDGLASLGPSEARLLMGAEGERLVGLVRGGDSSLDPPPETSASGLRAALTLLAKRLSGRLDRGRLRARGLELAVDYADGVTRERHTRLHRPTATPEDLAEAAFRLYHLLPRSTEPPVGLSLCATGLSSADQLDLFGSRAAREVRVALGRGEAPDLRN